MVEIEIYERKRSPIVEFFHKIKLFFKRRKKAKIQKKEEEIVDLTKHNIDYMKKEDD